MDIEIHPLTGNPTAAWQELSREQKVIKINVKPPTAEAPANKVSSAGFSAPEVDRAGRLIFIFFSQLRIVCMSDTHSLTPYIKFDVPDGDVFIHAGDFTKCGSLQEVVEFNTWIGEPFNLRRNLFIRLIIYFFYLGR